METLITSVICGVIHLLLQILEDALDHHCSLLTYILKRQNPIGLGVLNPALLLVIESCLTLASINLTVWSSSLLLHKKYALQVIPTILSLE